MTNIQRRNVTELVKQCYHGYFPFSAIHQDKNWAPHIYMLYDMPKEAYRLGKSNVVYGFRKTHRAGLLLLAMPNQANDAANDITDFPSYNSMVDEIHDPTHVSHSMELKRILTIWYET